MANILIDGVECEGIHLRTDKSNILLLQGRRGFLGCGYFDLATANRHEISEDRAGARGKGILKAGTVGIEKAAAANTLKNSPVVARPTAAYPTPSPPCSTPRLSPKIMKVPISDYELVDLDAPVLAAYEARIQGFTCWLVWCKHCGVWHRHGAGEGRREAPR